MEHCQLMARHASAQAAKARWLFGLWTNLAGLTLNTRREPSRYQAR